MQQIWRFRLWRSDRAVTVDGRNIEIVNPGTYNTGAGPDFDNARIRIDGQMWAGPVELHLRASDWHRHGHDGDPAYRNVVLHVVLTDDTTITMPDGRVLPQLVMSVGNDFATVFDNLLQSPRLVLPSCGDRLDDIASVMKTDWLTALAFERLQRKADDVGQRLDTATGDWTQTAFITLARGLGFGNNADNMERLARSVSLRMLLKHSDNPETIEAILFGQSGLLSDNPADDYEKTLSDEYRFYAHKYDLTAPADPVWRIASRNGANTPYRRIALLARIVATHADELGISLCENTSAAAVEHVFDIDAGPYWINHSAFGKTLSGKVAMLGKQSIDLLIINVITPLMYHRGRQTQRYDLMDGAVALLEKTQPENNAITRGFAKFNITAPDAFTSQALIQLHRGYCEPRRCLECRLGHRMLAQNIAL